MAMRLFEHVARHGLPVAAATEDRLERGAEAFRRWAAEQRALQEGQTRLAAEERVRELEALLRRLQGGAAE